MCESAHLNAAEHARCFGMATLLLDTYSLFYRAFHALPPMNTASGEPTNAL